MDPLTQGTLGAALPQSVANAKRMAQATFCGALAGMAPDLDVLIRSSEDPLLFLEFHRQFTHSLVFIPLGAAICAAVFQLAVGRRWGWDARQTYLLSLLGYGTHALLDACTSYGTQLLWPFSNQRVAWNNVSIVDPLVTVPLTVLVLLAWRKKRRVFARAAMAWVVAYMLLGVVARERAETHAAALAAGRGHSPERLEVKPSFANLLLWKSIYEAEDRYYVDAVRLGLFADAVHYEGSSVRALDLERDFPWLDPRSQQGQDVGRFRWFSQDFLAVDPRHPERIGDVRYSLLPNDVRPLWAITLDEEAGPEDHVGYVNDRSRDADMAARFGRMLRGEPL
ncbi:MAG: metal-dependent hydrolase [Myxococcota bacterium]